jgi:hypothetical protein
LDQGVGGVGGLPFNMFKNLENYKTTKKLNVLRTQRCQYRIVLCLISFLLENCITQVNDTRLPAEITEYLKYNMRSIESRKFRAHIADTTPGIDMTYEFEYVTKEGNKETFRAGFPIGSDFLWI